MLPLNPLWPSAAIRRHKSGSTLAQVMACCLTAPSHYLNQCWLIIIKVLWHSSEGIIMRRSKDTNQQNKIENYIFRITFRSPRGQWVKKKTQHVSSWVVHYILIVMYAWVITSHRKTMDVITYPCPNLNWYLLLKEAPGIVSTDNAELWSMINNS